MSDQTSNGIKPIDMREVFAKKAPRLSKFMPGFAYRYLNRVMHIREVNEIMAQYGKLEGIEFVNSVVDYFNVSEKVNGVENIPKEGKFIFASNHPLGGFDGLLLMSNVYKVLGEVQFLVNDVLMNIPQLGSLFVPIDKHGSQGRKFAKVVQETYKSDVQIMIFPSGYASRKIKGKVTDLEWKKHFIQKSIQYQRDIIPVHVSGQNSKFFYRLANFRKAIGLKWNLEMFFLADESFRHRGSKFTVTFGKPISHKSFDKSKTHKEWAEYVRKILYSLPEKN